MTYHTICKRQIPKIAPTSLHAFQRLFKGYAPFKLELSSPPNIPSYNIIMCKTTMNGESTFATNTFRAHLSTIRICNSFLKES